MSLSQAVNILTDIMEEWGLTKLEKGRVLSELQTGELSPRAEALWSLAQKRMAAKGITVDVGTQDAD